MSSVLEPLQAVTRNLPSPIRQAFVSVIGKECYHSLIWDLDISDTECIKYSVSKALGLGLVAGGAIVKVPQIVKILRSGSAKGLSLVSYLLDTASIAIVVAYNAQQHFPFSTYGENIFLGIQNVVIILLILAFSRSSAKVVKMTGFMAVCTASAYLLFSESITPVDVLRKLLALSIPLSLSSKIPQIAKIYSTGCTGQLSAFLVFNSLAGCLARVFTTATETGDRTLWWSFVSASALNAVLAAQMLWYWKDSAKASVKRLAEKVPAQQEKSRQSQPIATPAIAATPAKPASNIGVAPRSVHKSAGRSASTRYTRKVD